jgi:hypothetical protein
MDLARSFLIVLARARVARPLRAVVGLGRSSPAPTVIFAVTGRIMGAGGSLSQVGGRMSRTGRRVRAAVNPVSTAATGSWCHSALRHMLTGYGPAARQSRLIRHGIVQSTSRRPYIGQMKACGQRSTNCLTKTTTKCEERSNPNDRPQHTIDAC